MGSAHKSPALNSRTGGRKMLGVNHSMIDATKDMVDRSQYQQRNERVSVRQMVDKAKSPNAYDNKRGAALRTGGLTTTSSSNLLNRPGVDSRLSGQTSQKELTFGVGAGSNAQSPGRRVVGQPKDESLYKVESRTSLGRQSSSTYQQML